MPKVPTDSTTSVSPSPHTLKRNQACLNCRRRKLKCDAQRPACSTCVRSHKHQLAHASSSGQTVPEEPECTYDGVAAKTLNELPPKSKYEKLESRIAELEALLNESRSGSATMVESQSHDSFSFQGSGSPRASLSPPRLEVLWSSWPAKLPALDLLNSLCLSFFKFHPHANRILHAPTFMPLLFLPPTSPKFPALPLLHSICAMASLYSAAVSSPPLPNFSEVKPDEIFIRPNTGERSQSFAEMQAQYAKESAENLESAGESLFQVLTSRVILCLFYWTHSRWVDVFRYSGHTLRLSTALGLNVCFPFHSIAKHVRPPSLLPPARTVIEDETRRNVFWIAYANERQHGLGNGWALGLDDQDISQLLPVHGDLYAHGVLCPPQDRQWAHSQDLLLVHPESQTDSFILYVKANILISKVKAFNCRFRARNFAGDSEAVQTMSVCQIMRLPGDAIDPRGTSAFMELDKLVTEFQASFPMNFKNPIVGSFVDNHLFAACLMPHVAMISLHEPHAEVRQSGCYSAAKILSAARDILDYTHKIWNSSYDMTILDPFTSFCFFAAGRVLVRFLQVSVDKNQLLDEQTFRTDVEFLLSTISRLGERIPLAFRYAKMLADLVENVKPQADPGANIMWDDSTYCSVDGYNTASFLVDVSP